jgi:hypothetical protein
MNNFSAHIPLGSNSSFSCHGSAGKFDKTIFLAPEDLLQQLQENLQISMTHRNI